jgi:hypothetical protein
LRACTTVHLSEPKSRKAVERKQEHVRAPWQMGLAQARKLLENSANEDKPSKGFSESSKLEPAYK